MPITVRLKGGLGNQMFQYALARHIAHAKDTVVQMDRDFYLAHDPKRKYMLDAWNVREEFVQSGNPWVTVKEQGLKYQPHVFHLPDGITLDGYWQCETYFQPIMAILRNEFTPRKSLTREAEEYADEIAGCLSVSVHIRRGDYVGCKVHGGLSNLYYERAAARIWHKVPDAQFFIFSDDPDWVEKHFALPYPITIVRGNLPHEDMWLMGKCRHAIIANSTFSWWGAWLNPDLSRMVIAPEPWFRDASLDAEDIIPDRWIKLSEKQAEIETCRVTYPLTENSIVFDVGGYVGDWAAEIAHKYNPHIFIFEPIEHCFRGMVDRFRPNPKIKVGNCALSNYDGRSYLYMNHECSSLHVPVGPKSLVTIRDITGVMKEHGEIELLKLNIEGEEYRLLRHLLTNGLVGRCKNIQVQFHKLSDDSERERDELCRELSRTHQPTYSYPFVWENWQRCS